MSQTKNQHEAQRWFKTAEEDLYAAQALMQASAFAQACFYSQQAGAKAIKALWFQMDADPWGHSVQKLILEFPGSNRLPDLNQWIDRGALLDKFYIPTRYPNGLPDLTPGQVYTQKDAQQGITTAQALLSACREWLIQNG
ncbi:MAG: HEPN domain-containing protein [Chloroflexi bacterium]|nr:HEPN domain-containing protein [Chloroflexota bacterium]